MGNDIRLKEYLVYCYKYRQERWKYHLFTNWLVDILVLSSLNVEANGKESTSRRHIVSTVRPVNIIADKHVHQFFLCWRESNSGFFIVSYFSYIDKITLINPVSSNIIYFCQSCHKGIPQAWIYYENIRCGNMYEGSIVTEVKTFTGSYVP